MPFQRFFLNCIHYNTFLFVLRLFYYLKAFLLKPQPGFILPCVEYLCGSFCLYLRFRGCFSANSGSKKKPEALSIPR